MCGMYVYIQCMGCVEAVGYAMVCLCPCALETKSYRFVPSRNSSAAGLSQRLEGRRYLGSDSRRELTSEPWQMTTANQALYFASPCLAGVPRMLTELRLSSSLVSASS